MTWLVLEDPRSGRLAGPEISGQSWFTTLPAPKISPDTARLQITWPASKTAWLALDDDDTFWLDEERWRLILRASHVGLEDDGRLTELRRKLLAIRSAGTLKAARSLIEVSLGACGMDVVTGPQR